jgi:DNA-binding NarL/FixJ family response regulator
MPASEPTSPAEPPMMSLLTRRMRQILELLVQGKSEKEVASDLGVSPHTVHIHVTRMYSRLGVNSRAELLARFYRQGPARNHN